MSTFRKLCSFMPSCWLWTLHMGFQQLGFCASPLWDLDFQIKCKNEFCLKRRSLINSPVLLLISPGKTLLMLCLVQEWPDSWNEGLVILFMDTSMRDSSHSLLFVKLLWVLESAPLDNPPGAAVIPVARAPFTTMLFPSSQLPMNTHWYSTLQTASPFSSNLLQLHGACHRVSSGQLSSQQSFPSLWLKLFSGRCQSNI